MSDFYFLRNNREADYPKLTGLGNAASPIVVEPSGAGTGDSDRAIIVERMTALWAAYGQDTPTFVDTELQSYFVGVIGGALGLRTISIIPGGGID
jgi:hypothetical protein